MNNYSSGKLYRNRFTPDAPMPDPLGVLDVAIRGMQDAQYCVEKIMQECQESLAYGIDYRDKFERGQLDGWTDTDIARQDGECDLARRILKVLGYEIDYYFCGWPKLKRTEGDVS